MFLDDLAEGCLTRVKRTRPSIPFGIGDAPAEVAVDDDDVDRVGDLDLLGKERAALGAGRPIEVRWMKGRSRPYALGDAAKARSALSIAFHERCDMIVATAALTGDQPTVQEPTVVEFLNSDVVLRWAEVTLGL